MTRTVSFILILALSLFSLVVGAAEKTLAQKKHEKEQLGLVEKDAEHTRKKCGAPIEVAIEWEAAAALGAKNAAGYCVYALQGLDNVCETEEGKAAVRAGIKRLVCKAGTKNKRALKVNKGTMEFTIEWDAPNSWQYVSETLMKTL